MASTSNGAKVGVKAVQEKVSFDVDNGLADHTASQSHVYDYLEVHDPTYPLTPATDLLQTSRDGDLASATFAFGQLVNEAAQKENLELAALKVIYPNAEVENHRITTMHYMVVMKMFLCDLFFSESCISGVPHPKEYALLLSRLSGELGTYSFEDADSLLDPAAGVAECLGEMLTDMDETLKMLERDGELMKGLREAWGPDVVVYVRRATDKYAQCLLGAADALNQC